MKRSRKAILATAYHEAGHVVAAHFLDIPIRSVTIVPKGDAYGYVTRRGYAFNKREREILECGGFGKQLAVLRARVEDYAIYCMAGNIAQCHFAPGSSRVHHWASDRDSAMEGMQRLAFDNAFQSQRPMDREALRLWWRCLYRVGENLLSREVFRHAVRALARALMAQPTMQEADAKQVMYDAWRIQLQTGRLGPPRRLASGSPSRGRGRR